MKTRDLEEARRKGYDEGVKSKEPEIIKLEKTIQDLHNTLDDEKKIGVDKQHKIEELLQTVNILSLEKNISTKEIAQLKEQIKIQAKTIEDSKTEISKVQEQLSNANSRGNRLEAEVKSKNEELKTKDDQISTLTEVKINIQVKVGKLEKVDRDISQRATSILTQAINTLSQPEIYRIPGEPSDPNLVGKVEKIIKTEVGRRFDPEVRRMVDEESNRKATIELEHLKREAWPRWLEQRAIELQRKMTADLFNLLNGRSKISCNKCDRDTVIKEIQMQCPTCVDYEFWDLFHAYPKPHTTTLVLGNLISRSLTKSQ